MSESQTQGGKRPAPPHDGEGLSRKKLKKARKKNGRKNFDMSKYMQRYVSISIAYFGHNYRGFVMQPSTPETVEHYLFLALEKTCLIEDRKSCRYALSGRTDAGVSAVGQVISIKLRSKRKKPVSMDGDLDGAGETETDLLPRHEELDYIGVLNRNLPPDVRALAWADVPDHFSARFSPVSRTYRYFFPRRNLDIQRMQDACSLYLGDHDFRNFCKMNVVTVRNFRRNILSFKVLPVPRTSGFSASDASGCSRTMYMMEITGTAFLWHQVRMMAAVLFLIGSGHESKEVITQLLDVEKHPARPQYSLASEAALVLYSTNFQHLRFDKGNTGLSWIAKHYEKMWYDIALKASAALTFLGVVHDLAQHEQDKTALQSLQVATDYDPGYRSKVGAYVPLMARARAMTYDDKVENLSDRKAEKRDNYIKYSVDGPSERERAVQGRERREKRRMEQAKYLADLAKQQDKTC